MKKKLILVFSILIVSIVFISEGIELGFWGLKGSMTLFICSVIAASMTIYYIVSPEGFKKRLQVLKTFRFSKPRLARSAKKVVFDTDSYGLLFLEELRQSPHNTTKTAYFQLLEGFAKHYQRKGLTIIGRTRYASENDLTEEDIRLVITMTVSDGSVTTTYTFYQYDIWTMEKRPLKKKVK